MPDALAWSAAVLLALSFGWAALAKVVRFSSWRTALPAYGLSSSEKGAAAIVPVLEGLVVVVLLAISVKAGGSYALALLAIFSLAILRARARTGDRLPCGCFGSKRERDYRALLVRNALLGCLSAICIALGSREGLIAGAAAPEASDVFPLALTLTGLLVTAWAIKQARESMRRRETS
ncbi:MAG: hypothetical protein M3280_02495 [Actinomycetota bacterium]|nr:hypothetical protein [Actinomycetota bacterium]